MLRVFGVGFGLMLGWLLVVGPLEAGEFVKLFPNLPPEQSSEEQLRELAGRLTDPNAPADDNPAGKRSGSTYAGQFLDHEMTSMLRNLLEASPEVPNNARTAFLDLDHVYCGGLGVMPGLYNADGTFRLSVAPDGLPDLPREESGKAILCEPRNDENLIIAQVHLAFMLYHNHLIRRGLSFQEAQRQLVWRWQWIVVHELLPTFVGQEMVDSILTYNGAGKPKVKTKFFKLAKGKQEMPLEFAVAAYRIHTMVRLAYDMQGSGVKTQVFNLAGNDLHGSRPIPANLRLALHQFFEGVPVPPEQAGAPNPFRKMDKLVSRSLTTLPSPLVVEVGPPAVINLVERNLLRGRRVGLASYQDVARAMGEEPLTFEELELDPVAWSSAPLWYGIFQESGLRTGGQHLGPVGGRIVAETILELIAADKGSYMSQPQAWTPPRGSFTMVDLFLLND